MSNLDEVVVIATGTANVASVRAAFERAGLAVRVSSSPDRIRRAPRVVLPGVGAFGAAMQTLQATGIDEVLRERVAADQPLLGICLGFQLLTQASEESPSVRGLGIVQGTVRRFARRPDLRVPQFGWNRVAAASGARVLDEAGDAYFANSYRLGEAPPDCQAAWAEHGGPFVAAIERGALSTLR